ncbi:hypothetical protein RCL1_007708 [Eukaryota sp. TZLM3-RCL]
MSALDCPICRNKLNDPHCLPCGHSFCRTCITSWLTTRQQCPTCRKRSTSTNLSPNFQLSDLLEELSQTRIIPTIELQEMEKPFHTTSTTSLHYGYYKQQPIILKQYLDPSHQDLPKKQFDLLKSLDFPHNLVRIHGTTQNPPGIVSEALTYSYQEFLHHGTILTIPEVLLIVKDLVSAVLILHDNSYVHCSICADNLFIKVLNGVVLCAKLGHLESVYNTFFDDQLFPSSQSVYTPPEVLINPNTIITKSFDIFSLGILLFSLFTSSDPILEAESHDLYLEVITNDSCLPFNMIKIEDESVRLLLERMMSLNPNFRPNIIQVHDFFNTYVDEFVDVQSNNLSIRVEQPVTLVSHVSFSPVNMGTHLSLSSNNTVVTCSGFSTSDANLFVSISAPLNCVRLTFTLLKRSGIRVGTYIGFSEAWTKRVVSGVAIQNDGCYQRFNGKTGDNLGPGLVVGDAIIVYINHNAVDFSASNASWRFSIGFQDHLVFGVLIHHEGVSWSVS